ncbi:ATP-binding protein [Caldimonas sp. KR1-144]|uniref:ATP-binding protein n=1 Tax=Caldimonas sp. KR1-144 TaxID=3400911 RepID=UPI003C01E2DC
MTASPSSASSDRDFPLLRYYSLTALALMLLAASVLALGYKVWVESDLVEQGGRANATLTRAIHNALADDLRHAASSGERRIEEIDRTIRRMIGGTPIHKVKIYDARGITVYSTERGQIGQSQAATPAFQRARRGQIVNTVSFRHRFNSIEGEVFDRNLLSSYVPVADATGRVDAVFELYQDMPDFGAQARASSMRGFALIFGVMLLLYGGLLLVVRRGARVIERQRRSLYEVHQHLVDAKQAAERASRSKSAFLANMSHEIRTPLHGMLGLAALLQQSSLSSVQSRYVASLESSGKALLRIINDVLDLSKIEADRMTIEETEFDLRAMVEEVASLMSPTARQKGLEWHTEIDAGLPHVVRGDPVRLQQVLTNLVGNAIKFTDRGSVRLIVSAWRRGSSDVRFSVVDSGVGMAAEALDRVFEPFIQADASTSRRYGGTGLGLAIVAGIVKTMGGRIDVRSAPGAGSAFHFICTLPRVEAPQPPPAATADAPSPASAAPALRRFLLAEDNPVNQLYAQALLARMNHDVCIVSNGREAVETWSSQGPFDAILMDCHMPECDGYQAARTIREIERSRGLPRTPIIAVTASVMTEDRAECLQHGMDAVLGKPFSPQELEQALGDSALEALRAQLPPLPPAFVGPKPRPRGGAGPAALRAQHAAPA